MSSSPKLFAFVLTTGLMAQTASALLTIDTVYVGDIGNSSDPTTGLGAVNYGYSIGKYEVTVSQYVGFLNAVAATDTYQLYNGSVMRGVLRSGSSGSYVYSVVGNGNCPVESVSWFDAARFANWLHNGQPTGAQVAGTTETGSYTLNGSVSGTVVARNAGWTCALPSENEWYKAAYYQPATQGGDADNYWLYPTRSNDLPNSRNGSNSDPNSANFFRDDGIDNGFNGGYAVNNSTTPPPLGDRLTEVGSFSLAASYYGTYDQAGNLMEWLSEVAGLGTAMRRGGSYNDTQVGNLFVAGGITGVPHVATGFRIVVPEPSIVSIMALTMIVYVQQRKRAGSKLKFFTSKRV